MDELQQKKVSLSGIVTRRILAPGSKSEHTGVVLRIEGGEEYALRRVGGNAFDDAKLNSLLDRRIDASGYLLEKTFIMEKWKLADAGPSKKR